MAMLVKFWGGSQLYLERDRWSSAGRFVEWRVDRDERLIWIGRWHLVWTPSAWVSRGSGDGRLARS
jgi:hypothetical protein